MFKHQDKKLLELATHFGVRWSILEFSVNGAGFSRRMNENVL